MQRLTRFLTVPTAGSFPAVGRYLRVTAGLAVAAGLLAVPAHAAAAPSLTPQTTITGSGTGWTRVTLTRPLPVDGVPKIAVDKPASFTGVALVREKSFEPESAFVVRHETATGTVYRYGWAGKTTHRGDKNYPVYALRVLPAGTYRLYLMATGPVKATVTWSLPGRGSSVLRPAARTTSFDTQQMSPGVPGVAVASSHTLSGDRQMARRSLLLSYSWYSGTVSAVESFGGCKSEGTDPAPMAPVCPDSNLNLFGVGAVTPTSGIAVGYAYVYPGHWLNKSYFALGGHLTDGGNALYWLDLGAGFPA